MTKFLDEGSDDKTTAAVPVADPASPQVQYGASQVNGTAQSAGPRQIEFEGGASAGPAASQGAGRKTRASRQAAPLLPIAFREEYGEGALGKALTAIIVLTCAVQVVALAMFLFNGVLAYQNFWFTLVFTLLSVLLAVAQFRVQNFAAWLELNFRFLLRKVAAVVFHAVIVVVYPYALSTDNIVMLAASALMLASIALWVVELALFIAWRHKARQ